VVNGLRLVSDHPLLRPLAAATSTWSFCGGFFGALYGLYVLREVGLSPAVLGLLVGSGGVGALVGALLVQRVTRRFGLGPTLIGSLFFLATLGPLVPLASEFAKPVAALLLLLNQIVGDVAVAIYMISALTLRQAITPDEKLGRVNATFEFVVGGIGTAGLLVGGLLGQAIGIRPSLVIAVLGMLLACLWLLFSPIRGLQKHEAWPVEAGHKA
jgi:predicted MFS family arabinose efflux permease